MWGLVSKAEAAGSRLRQQSDDTSKHSISIRSSNLTPSSPCKIVVHRERVFSNPTFYTPPTSTSWLLNKFAVSTPDSISEPSEPSSPRVPTWPAVTNAFFFDGVHADLRLTETQSHCWQHEHRPPTWTPFIRRVRRISEMSGSLARHEFSFQAHVLTYQQGHECYHRASPHLACAPWCSEHQERVDGCTRVPGFKRHLEQG